MISTIVLMPIDQCSSFRLKDRTGEVRFEDYAYDYEPASLRFTLKETSQRTGCSAFVICLLIRIRRVKFTDRFEQEYQSRFLPPDDWESLIWLELYPSFQEQSLNGSWWWLTSIQTKDYQHDYSQTNRFIPWAPQDSKPGAQVAQDKRDELMHALLKLCVRIIACCRGGQAMQDFVIAGSLESDYGRRIRCLTEKWCSISRKKIRVCAYQAHARIDNPYGDDEGTWFSHSAQQSMDSTIQEMGIYSQICHMEKLKSRQPYGRWNRENHGWMTRVRDHPRPQRDYLLSKWNSKKERANFVRIMNNK